MISPELTRLVKHLRQQPAIPIRLKTIQEWIEENTGNKIHVFSTPLQASETRAAIRYFEDVSEDPPRRIARIYVSDQLDRLWGRFAICKEMMHILDPDSLRTSTSAQAVEIVENLNNFGFDLESLETRPAHEIADKIARISALVAFGGRPEIRMELKTKFHKGEISLAEAVEFLGIPAYWSQLVMSSHFDEAEEAILN